MPTVTSRDGTKIAYERHGTGPAVVLVNGALGDRTLDKKFKMMTKLAELLSPEFTVIDYDRRGRGDSDEGGPFSVQREIEDIAALIQVAGGTASLFGFSSGGALALRAAGADIGVERVAVYEVPFVVNRDDKGPQPDYGQRLDELVGAQDRSGAVKHFMRGAMGMPAPAVLAMKVMPAWKLMKANASTLPYDWAALGEHNMQGNPLQAQEWASVTMPALVIYGGKSPSTLQNGSRALADVLPSAELRVLDGMGHRLKVPVLAPVLAEFLGTETATND
ncbi:MAG: alpha/beta hydrolase [Solirubrobacterales bacterium]|nr:alpha/beta hydrolase [Solirubrobacterales bacterium]